MRVTLASASPRRKELIKKISGLEVNIIPAQNDEYAEFYNPGSYACMLARNKASEVFAKTGGVVIGADTIVYLDKIMGKPSDENEAKQMLRELSGKTHSVITGVCVIRENKTQCAFCETKVTFGNFTEKFIDDYVSTGSPLDKAGAYGLQDELLSSNVVSVDGDTDNVIGLPVKLLQDILEEKY